MHYSDTLRTELTPVTYELHTVGGIYIYIYLLLTIPTVMHVSRNGWWASPIPVGY